MAYGKERVNSRTRGVQACMRERTTGCKAGCRGCEAVRSAWLVMFLVQRGTLVEETVFDMKTCALSN